MSGNKQVFVMNQNFMDERGYWKFGYNSPDDEFWGSYLPLITVATESEILLLTEILSSVFRCLILKVHSHIFF